MSSRYQTTTTTTTNNYNNDNRLDELLEDLQSTVAPRPIANGNATTGYRQTYKTYSTQKSGYPAETSRECEIEYLNPSNTTSVITERSKSPFFDKENMNLTNGKNASAYKTVSYEYSTKRSGSQPTSPVFENKQTEKSEAKFRKNINELDSLLDDLNHTQKIEFSSTGSNQSNRIKGYDSGFIEPLDSSTPLKNSHISRIEEKSFEEQRYGTVNSAPIRHTEVKKEVIYNGEPVESYVDKYSTTNDFKKDLVFTGGSLRHREPSPGRQLQEVYHYETKTTSSRKGTEVPPPRSVSRNYNYESDVTDNSIPYSSERYVTNSYDYNRSPSPARSAVNYNTVSSSSTLKESTLPRSPSPTRSYYSTTSSVPNITPQPVNRSAMYSSRIVQETTRRETQRSPTTPPPHRSPSPVSFALPPDPSLESTVKTYDFERSSNNVARPQSPQFKQRFSPSDPSRDTVPGGHTLITRNYKYTSQSTQNGRYPGSDGYRPEPSPVPISRPFPAPSPQPEIKEQKPPKQLDELMASFSDSESQHHREVFNRYTLNRSSNRSHVPVGEPVRPKTPPSAPVPTEKIHTIETQKLNETTKEKMNGVAGPPVYYPPGPLFSKKEECSAISMEQNAGAKGKMNAKRKAKYKYESGSKMKESSDTKKTVVPLCLPVCCALPCAIM